MSAQKKKCQNSANDFSVTFEINYLHSIFLAVASNTRDVSVQLNSADGIETLGQENRKVLCPV
jgi:hypothetical protein